LDEVTIAGRITDQAGALVSGARVTALLATTGAARTVETDASGRYRFVELLPGAYNVGVVSRGFAVAEQQGVEAVAGESVRLDFVLRPAGVAAEQTITDEQTAAALDTTRTVVGATLTRAELDALPNATRAPLDLALTLPGVTEEPLATRDLAEDRARSARQTPEEAGTLALAGGAAYSNNFTIDGLDNNDDRAARERFQPSLEAVAEVQVITNQFAAEYGRASGGRINLRTRGGAKDFSGRAFYFFRDESLDANTFFNNARGLKRLPLQQHTPGFTLSGPLTPKRLFTQANVPRPRTFFFTAYEYNTVLDTTLIDTLMPVLSNPRFPLPSPTTLTGRRTEAAQTTTDAPAELAPYVALVNTPSRAHALTTRIDHDFAERHNGTLLWQLGRSRNLRQFGGGSRLADALQGRTRNTDAVAYTDNLILSARTVNQLRAQLSRLTPALRTSARDNARPVVLVNLDDPLPASDPANRSGTLVAGASTAGASDRRETRWQLQDTLTLVSGAHTFKVGGDLQRVRSTFIDLADATGTYNFASAADFLDNAPNRFRQRFNTDSTQRNSYAGLFAQAEWRARPRLNVTAGLRYERETILRDLNNFAPRLGLAYDPTGAGRTAIRLGAGVFFNRALLRTIDDFTLGRARVLFDTNALTDPATGRLLTDEQRRAFIAANLNFPQTLAADSPLVRQHGTVETNFARQLDPLLRIPESYQFNAGFEHGFGRALVFEINYTFNRAAHLWRELNVNAPRLPSGYRDFAAYLLARDFPNFRDRTGTRPLYNASAAGELVRFTLAPFAPDDPNAIGRIVEAGVPVTVFNLNSINSTTALVAAHAAVNDLRPDPARGELEQLVSAGDSFYHGLTVEARRRFAPLGALSFSLRAAYTLSRLVDDGVVNTSDALRPGDFRAERAPSLLDRRQRLVLSGVFDLPPALARLRVAPVLRLASGAPFNLSLGVDRNLDDVDNDRPVFDGDSRLLRSRRADEPLAAALLNALALPTIGQTGNLPRNAGRGPAFCLFDLNVMREFRFGERVRLRPSVEFDNVLNHTVFSFGAEFVNFNALRPDATDAQRQTFRDTFLVPTRTLRPRALRLGLRLDF
jgi:hypothetical protein